MIVLLAALLLPQDGSTQEALSRVGRTVRRSVSPSVVAIRVSRITDPEGRGPRGKRAEHAEYYRRPRGFCSGTVIDAEGLIATSAFNVSGKLRRIEVHVPGHENPYEAKLLGANREKDIALLKIEPDSPLPVLPRADLGELKVGQFTFVVGRAPDPAEPTLNFGILSAVHRFDGTHLQTDAELNYGNVGGPLVDVRGRLIGITTHIDNQVRWGQSGGVGFALRMDRVEGMLEELKNGGKPAEEPRRVAFLGVVPAVGARGLEGVQVARVLGLSPAEDAGLREGDIITEFAGRKVTGPEQLGDLIRAHKPGDRVKIKFTRKGHEEPLEKSLTLSSEDEF